MNSAYINSLRNHLSQLDSNPIEDRTSSLCTTISGSCAPSLEPFWVQLHRGQINFKHLDSTGKDIVLGEILDAVESLGEVELEPGSFVTFEVSSLGDPTVDLLLTSLLELYFGVNNPEAIEIATKDL